MLAQLIRAGLMLANVVSHFLFCFQFGGGDVVGGLVMDVGG